MYVRDKISGMKSSEDSKGGFCIFHKLFLCFNAFFLDHLFRSVFKATDTMTFSVKLAGYLICQLFAVAAYFISC